MEEAEARRKHFFLSTITVIVALWQLAGGHFKPCEKSFCCIHPSIHLYIHLSVCLSIYTYSHPSSICHPSIHHHHGMLDSEIISTGALNEKAE